MDPATASRETELPRPVPGVALLAVAAVGLVAAAITRTRGNGRRDAHSGVTALTAYLREHLSGSDVAIAGIEKLRRSERGDDGLWQRLLMEFQEERDVVRDLLTTLRASSLSVKRLAAQASVPLLVASAGGERGELSLFRTLEGLAVGVQGKRCLWRAMQTLESHLPSGHGRKFSDLEAQAVRQWESIEERRLSLVPDTFSMAARDRAH